MSPSSRRGKAANAGSSYEIGVYVHDLRSRRTTRLVPEGVHAGQVSDPDLSGDGRHLAFSASVRSPGGWLSQVFVHDFDTGRTVLVSRASEETKGNGESYDPSISDDGRHVAFTSTATNLTDSFGKPRSRVYVHDLRQETTEAVSGGEGFAFEPAISGDGRHVSFASVVPGEGVTGRESQVYVRDLQAATTALVSRESGKDGAPAEGFSTDPAISRDGRYVSFASDAGEPQQPQVRQRQGHLRARRGRSEDGAREQGIRPRDLIGTKAGRGRCARARTGGAGICGVAYAAAAPPE